MEQTAWMRIGGIAGFLAVALGAFGAHGLESFLIENQVLDTWETAVLYHLAHAVAILLPAAQRHRRVPAAALFAAGILVFSGSLYLLCLSGMKWLGAVTPLGGLLFLAGWIRLALK